MRTITNNVTFELDKTEVDAIKKTLRILEDMKEQCYLVDELLIITEGNDDMTCDLSQIASYLDELGLN